VRASQRKPKPAILQASPGKTGKREDDGLNGQASAESSHRRRGINGPAAAVDGLSGGSQADPAIVPPDGSRDAIPSKEPDPARAKKIH